MNTSSSLRMRPQSAKYVLSSNKKNVSMRSQAKQDSKVLYTQHSYTKVLNSLTKINAPQLRRLLPKKIDMSPQRLFEENMALKKKLNECQNELRVQKAKGETAERRNAKWKKKLDIQFEKEMYWGQKGQYMVMGVKNQYDKIKKLYDDKCQQNHQIRRSIKYTQLQQVTAELQVYKQEVGRLKQELDKIIEIYQIPYNPKDEDESSLKLYILELKQTISRFQYESSTYKTGIKNMDKIIKDRDEKIEFLEKLVVDKDNHSHQLEQSLRRVQYQNQNVKTKNKELKEKMDEEKNALQNKIQEIKNSEERRLEREIGYYENELQVKNQKITKLDAEIVYLSTLLAQWRPTENDSFRNTSLVERNQDVRPPTVQRKESNLALSIHQEDMKQKDQNEQSKSELEPFPMSLSSISKRQKNTNTHYTLKKDKVRKEQIENICFELKFRFLNKKITISQAKSYIKCSEGDQITIKDLLQIFTAQPFCVQAPQRRILLARYLIEDVDDNFVFYDQLRSQPLVIVSSIFEQIIPKYSIPSEAEEAAIRSKVTEMLSKYHTTLTQVVTQHNRQLILNQKTFIEILNQQELNMGGQYNDFMMSHMLKSSPDITQMSFKSLLTLVPSKKE